MLAITVLRWDPIGDLDAFVATRKEAWASSLFEILAEERVPVDPGAEGALFRIRGPEGTSVKLTIRRKDSDTEVVIGVVRRRIKA